MRRGKTPGWPDGVLGGKTESQGGKWGFGCQNGHFGGKKNNHSARKLHLFLQGQGHLGGANSLVLGKNNHFRENLAISTSDVGFL